jgi:hypothetical protein
MRSAHKLLFAGLLISLSINFSCSNPLDPQPAPPLSSQKDIVSFAFPTSDNPDLAFVCQGTIVETSSSISCLLPASAASFIDSLTPCFTLSAGASSSPPSGLAQDFSSPVLYQVTAEDGSVRTYEVSISVASSENSAASSLSALEIWAGSDAYNLLSGFASDTLSYDVPVAASVSSVRITPTASYVAATITVGKGSSTPQAVVSGSTTSAIPLSSGQNTIEVTVTSFDRTTTTAYTLNVEPGAPTPVIVGSGWTSGLVTDSENISVGGGLLYTFSASVGKYYQVAVDADDLSPSSAGWTPDNGGWPGTYGNGPSASVYAAVYRADGTTVYEYPEDTRPTDYADYFLADRNIRYVTILALDDTVKVKISGSSSFGTFALQVRERDTLPSPAPLALRAWQVDSFPSDPWTSQDLPCYTFPTTVGARYRVGVDDAYDGGSEDRGWSMVGFGVPDRPTAASVEMRVLRADGTPYAYVEGDTGWIEADYFDEDIYEERRYVTIDALDSSVQVQLRVGAYHNWGEGSFAVQARPVVASVTDLSPGTSWTTGSFEGEEIAWDQVKAFSISTSPGRIYEIGVDDRETHDDLNWNPLNGGSSEVADCCLEQRILQSDGSVASYAEATGAYAWISPDASGWVEADGNMPGGSPDYRQRRYLTVISGGTSLCLELKSILRSEPGTFAVQVREVPLPTSLTVEASWFADTIEVEDGWDLANLRLYSFDATPGTTYYVMVDDKYGDWMDNNGGYVPEPTAQIMGVAIEDGSAYVPGYSYPFAHMDNSKYFTVSATASTVSLAFTTGVLDGGDGTYAIKVSTAAP